MEQIEIKNLYFKYNEEDVLKDISFNIKKGSYISIIGHNGSGKSTLAKLLIGLIFPSKGQIFIENKEVNSKNINDIRKHIALVFQNPDNQFIGATVEDDIAFGLENKNVPQDDMQKIINKFAKETGMEEFLKKEPQNLSGGQKQRVAIAGALAMSPDIIIFDEATSMLDPKGKDDINDLIHKMRKENKDLTIISITHDVEEANNSDEIIVLKKGEIVKIGKPSEIFLDRKMIQDAFLDVPFVYRFIYDLKENSIDINASDIESLGEAICRLK